MELVWRDIFNALRYHHSFADSFISVSPLTDLKINDAVTPSSETVTVHFATGNQKYTRRFYRSQLPAEDWSVVRYQQTVFVLPLSFSGTTYIQATARALLINTLHDILPQRLKCVLGTLYEGNPNRLAFVEVVNEALDEGLLLRSADEIDSFYEINPAINELLPLLNTPVPA